MPRASTMPGEMLAGGFFKAGKYLVLKAGYAVHQFFTKDNVPAGKPGVMMGLELVQLADTNDGIKVAPDALRLDQWYPVGGNLEMFYPSNEDDKKVEWGQFVGSPTAGGIFDDSSASQFSHALLNTGGYPPERWKESDAYGLAGCVMVLSEVPDKKSPQAATDKKAAAGSRMAQDAKAAGADKDRPRTVVVPTEVVVVPDDVFGGGSMPKAKWPKGTPEKVATLAERSHKPAGAGAKSNGGAAASKEIADTGDAGDFDEEAINALLAASVTEAVGESATVMDVILTGKINTAINALDGVPEEVKSSLKDMAKDKPTRSAIMTGAGYNLSGANWKKTA